MEQHNRLGSTFYKYMSRRFAQGLIQQGSVRIGTLHEYRNDERYGPAIGDPDEGMKAIWSTDNMYADIPESIPDFTKDVVSLTGKGSSMTNCEVVLKLHSPNVFVFSISSKLSKSILDRFPGYDTVVKISNTKQFVRALTNALGASSLIEPKALLADCIYMPRSTYYKSDTGAHPALIKDLSFAYQAEVRVLWQPRTEEICPQVLDIPGLQRFCRILSDREIREMRCR